MPTVIVASDATVTARLLRVTEREARGARGRRKRRETTTPATATGRASTSKRIGLGASGRTGAGSLIANEAVAVPDSSHAPLTCGALYKRLTTYVPGALMSHAEVSEAESK